MTPEKLVTIGVDHVRIGDQIFNPVRMGDVFDGLAGAVKKNFGYEAPPRRYRKSLAASQTTPSLR